MSDMNLPENVTATVAREFFDFSLGNQSSADAYVRIDRQVLTWNYDPAWLNQTRELFEALRDAARDFDIERPGINGIDPLMANHGLLSIEQYDFYTTGEPFVEAN
jgi:hypothetical protein